MDKLSGLIEKIHYASDEGFVIFTIVEEKKLFRHVVQGSSRIYEGDVVTCDGEWITYKGEPRFKAKLITPEIPTSTKGILSYLSSGRVKGINKKLAKKLVNHFGSDILDVVENDPDRLTEVAGFGKKLAQKLIEGLSTDIAERSILIFLNEFNMPKNLVNKIHRKYGIKAVSIIRENPYQLIGEIGGVGFRIADKIAMSSGIKANSHQRLQAGVLYTISTECKKTGSTAIRLGNLISICFEKLGEAGPVTRDEINTGIQNAIKTETVIPFKDSDGEELIFPADLFGAERNIAKNLLRLQGPATTLTVDAQAMEEMVEECARAVSKKPLDSTQKDAVKLAILNPVSIITGGPGTGKTTIMKVLVQCLTTTMGIDVKSILLTAPTGKAAERLSESTGIAASTVHRALKYSPEAEAFMYSSENKLPYRVIVVDEASMADTHLASSLIEAVATGSRLVIVGDIKQLPSVGPGSVLHDLITSGAVPCIRLTNVYRQGEGSLINIYANLIDSGVVPDLDARPINSDFYFIKRNTDAEIYAEMESIGKRLVEKYKVSAFDDIQYLTPMRKTEVGVYNLNRLIQKELNGKALGTGIKIKLDDEMVEFCAGDKVIHIENNKELGVFNGTTGRILEVDQKAREIKVQYDGQVVKYTAEYFDQLRLAYAITIHKSQGSEYKFVIIPCTTSHWNMLYRSLFYTGITRAKVMVIVVGSVKAFTRVVNTTVLDKRVTGLVRQIKEEKLRLAA